MEIRICKNSEALGESAAKYIATAVEALLAAIYLDNNENFGLVVDIAKSWKNLIDEEKNKQQ